MKRFYLPILIVLLGSGVGCMNTVGYGTRHRMVYSEPYGGYASANTRLDVQVQSSYVYGYDGYGYGYGRRGVHSANYGRYDRYDSSASRSRKDRTPPAVRPPSTPARPATPSAKPSSGEAKADAQRRAQIRVMTNPVPFSPLRQQLRQR